MPLEDQTKAKKSKKGQGGESSGTRIETLRPRPNRNHEGQSSNTKISIRRQRNNPKKAFTEDSKGLPNGGVSPSQDFKAKNGGNKDANERDAHEKSDEIEEIINSNKTPMTEEDNRDTVELGEAIAGVSPVDRTDVSEEDDEDFSNREDSHMSGEDIDDSDEELGAAEQSQAINAIAAEATSNSNNPGNTNTASAGTIGGGVGINETGNTGTRRNSTGIKNPKSDSTTRNDNTGSTNHSTARSSNTGSADESTAHSDNTGPTNYSAAHKNSTDSTNNITANSIGSGRASVQGIDRKAFGHQTPTRHITPSPVLSTSVRPQTTVERRKGHRKGPAIPNTSHKTSDTSVFDSSKALIPVDGQLLNATLEISATSGFDPSRALIPVDSQSPEDGLESSQDYAVPSQTQRTESFATLKWYYSYPLVSSLLVIVWIYLQPAVSLGFILISLFICPERYPHRGPKKAILRGICRTIAGLAMAALLVPWIPAGFSQMSGSLEAQLPSIYSAAGDSGMFILTLPCRNIDESRLPIICRIEVKDISADIKIYSSKVLEMSRLGKQISNLHQKTPFQTKRREFKEQWDILLSMSRQVPVVEDFPSLDYATLWDSLTNVYTSLDDLDSNIIWFLRDLSRFISRALRSIETLEIYTENLMPVDSPEFKRKKKTWTLFLDGESKEEYLRDKIKYFARLMMRDASEIRMTQKALSKMLGELKRTFDTAATIVTDNVIVAKGMRQKIISGWNILRRDIYRRKWHVQEPREIQSLDDFASSLEDFQGNLEWLATTIDNFGGSVSLVGPALHRIHNTSDQVFQMGSENQTQNERLKKILEEFKSMVEGLEDDIRIGSELPLIDAPVAKMSSTTSTSSKS